jgi:hypothetical protein
MDFEIIGEITEIETIARGKGVRNRTRLQRQYGQGRWRRLKGVAYVRLIDGSVRFAEIHWYQAQGIGKREFKLKLPFLD